MPVTVGGLKAPVIQKARIVDVDMDSYTLTVASEYLQSPQSGISFASPYQHQANGEGIYFMPEVGSVVWLCFPSDHSRPFVLAWASSQVQGNFRANKKDLNPGDIFMGTRDENFLILRRGGIVQIGGGPLSQRMYIPVQNFIKDFCENYGLHTLGGDLEWLVRRPETSSTGKSPASLKISAKEFTDDPHSIAELEIGSHDGDGTTILSLNVKDTGQDGNQAMVSLALGKDGSVTWDCQAGTKWTLLGDFDVETEGNATLKATQKVTINGATEVDVQSTVAVNVTAPAIALAGQVALGPGGGTMTVDSSGAKVGGSGAKAVIIDSTDLEAWIAKITALLAGATAGTPVVTTGPGVIIPPTSHKSSKLSAE